MRTDLSLFVRQLVDSQTLSESVRAMRSFGISSTDAVAGFHVQQNRVALPREFRSLRPFDDQHTLPSALLSNVSHSMDAAKHTELLSVNCGRCGKPLKMPIEALLHRHTVDCSDCEKHLRARRALPTTAGRSLPLET